MSYKRLVKDVTTLVTFHPRFIDLCDKSPPSRPAVGISFINVPTMHATRRSDRDTWERYLAGALPVIPWADTMPLAYRYPRVARTTPLVYSRWARETPIPMTKRAAVYRATDPHMRHRLPDNIPLNPLVPRPMAHLADPLYDLKWVHGHFRREPKRSKYLVPPGHYYRL